LARRIAYNCLARTLAFLPSLEKHRRDSRRQRIRLSTEHGATGSRPSLKIQHLQSINAPLNQGNINLS
jgi:hypothetical protein